VKWWLLNACVYLYALFIYSGSTCNYSIPLLDTVQRSLLRSQSLRMPPILSNQPYPLSMLLLPLFLFSSLPLHLYHSAHYLPNCHASLDLHMTLPCPHDVCMNTMTPPCNCLVGKHLFHLVVSLVLKLHPSIPSLAIWISARGPGELYHISDVTRRNTL